MKNVNEASANEQMEAPVTDLDASKLDKAAQEIQKELSEMAADQGQQEKAVVAGTLEDADVDADMAAMEEMKA